MTHETSTPERFFPSHLGGAMEKGEAKEKERKKALEKAPDLEKILRAEKSADGQDIPPNINLSFQAIHDFQRAVQEAQDLRKVARGVRDPKEKVLAVKLLAERKKEVDRFLVYGLSFESAYREYIHARKEARVCITSLEQAAALERLLTEPSFASMNPEVEFSPKAEARLETIMRGTEGAEVTESDEATLLASLKTIFPEESPAFKKAKEELFGNDAAALPRTKKDIEREIIALQKKAEALWEKPIVRRLLGERQVEKILMDFASGKDVIEMPSVIDRLNTLDAWEQEHQRITIGAVLVGPPGVGKTTLVRHYLEAKQRHYVYIDLSEDVTRYLLYGSKSVDFKSPVEYHRRLADDLQDLDDEGFKKFITENLKAVRGTFHLADGNDDAAAVTLLDQIEKELQKAEGEASSPEEADHFKKLRAHVSGLAERVFRKELATDFGHLVKKNGWRDGVLIESLRRGQSIIFDEFNKNKNWSLIYGLMTAKPGEQWYFADNKEWITIPDSWRMYFTANIGRKHGGFVVPEALASRAGGKVMEINYPSEKEEMLVALSSLSDPQGDFLRSNDDLAKLFVLVNELFPKVRHFIEEKPQGIPISYRTLRDLGEKLVLARDPKTQRRIHKPTSRSFDAALYAVLVESYALYEDKTIPKEIVQLATSVGLFLDDDVKEKVVAWIGNDAYTERKESFAKHREDFSAIVEKIQGLRRDLLEDAMPTVRKFT